MFVFGDRVIGAVCRGALLVMLVSGLFACSATRPGDGDQGASLPEDGGTTANGAAGEVSGSATAGAPGVPSLIDVPDVADAQTVAMAEACSVIDLATLSGRCEGAAAMGGATCADHVLDDACTYFQFAWSDAAHTGSPTAICRRRCEVLETTPSWTDECDACTNICPSPQRATSLRAGAPQSSPRGASA